jgi:hypothetical protein
MLGRRDLTRWLSRRLDAGLERRDDPVMTWVVVVSLVIIVAAVAFVVVAYRQRWRWAGFAAEPEPGHKTVWDWLQLLIVPAILVGVTFAWSASQTRSDNKREDRRIAADRVAAEEVRQDTTLQSYLNQISDLMLHEGLLQPETTSRGHSVRAVARTATRSLHDVAGAQQHA